MTRASSTLALIALALVGCGEGVPKTIAPAMSANPKTKLGRRTPKKLVYGQFATPQIHWLGHFLEPTLTGERPGDWGLFNKIRSGLGSKIETFFDANLISEAINQSLSTEGQPFAKLDALVAECAEILHVNKPDIRVRNSAEARATFVRVGDANFLVLTSGLLELFESRPEELRFVVGRELARGKGPQAQYSRRLGPIVSILHRIPLATLTGWVPPVGPLGFASNVGEQSQFYLKRAIGWCRENEFTLDRAGLLCCQDEKLAFNALARLQSGIKASSAWLDPDSKDFNADAILSKFDHCRTIPELISFVIESGNETVPFVPDRIAQLKQWIKMGDYERTLSTGEQSEVTLILTSAKVFDLLPNRTDIDPYLVIRDAKGEILRTTYLLAREFNSAGHRATWSELDTKVSADVGHPLFIEIWDSNSLGDSMIGGFQIQLEPDKRSYKETIRWDWNVPSQITESASAEIIFKSEEATS